MLEPLVALVAVALIAVTLLPLLPLDVWWVRACDFPRLQVLFIGALVLPLLAFYPAWPPGGLEGVLTLMLLACLVYQGYRIYPYTPLAKIQALPAAPGGTRLRAMSVNVLMSNRRSGDLLSLIERVRPDLILAVEVDRWWAEQLAGLGERYRYQVTRPQDNTYGLALYSRYQLVQPELRFLLKDDVPSVFGRLRLADDELVDLYAVHPQPPGPSHASKTTERDAELLIVARQIERAGRPALVMGDLNDVAWSHTSRLFQRISDMLDPRVGRGVFATFHAKIPLLRWPLDHFFFSEHFRLAAIEVLPAFGSDHFPICVELAYQPRRRAAQPQTQAADVDDREEIGRTVKQAKRRSADQA